LKLLKDYTIYKNESDKEFNQIIDEIKQDKLESRDNSKIIFEHLSSIKVKMYSQKNSWNLVTKGEQLPTHHTEGLVFCSTKRNFFE
jgi:hypothetical protein